jgi:hypothetical protein
VGVPGPPDRSWENGWRSGGEVGVQIRLHIRHVRRISGHPGKVGGKVGVHIRVSTSGSPGKVGVHIRHIRTSGQHIRPPIRPHPGDRPHPSHPLPVRFPRTQPRPPAWPAGKSGANNSTMVMSAREKPRRGRIGNLLVGEIQSNAFPAEGKQC